MTQWNIYLSVYMLFSQHIRPECGRSRVRSPAASYLKTLKDGNLGVSLRGTPHSRDKPRTGRLGARIMCLSGVYMHHCGMVLQWASTLKLVKDWASTKQYIHTHAYTNVSKFQKLFSSRMAVIMPLRRKASSHTHAPIGMDSASIRMASTGSTQKRRVGLPTMKMLFQNVLVAFLLTLFQR